MAATARTLLGTLKTQLANIDGTGSYNHDLSATDAIQIGRYPDPPFAPFMFLSLETVSSSFVHPETGQGAPFDHYWREVVVLVRGFVGGGDVEDRTLEAIDLLADLYRAIEADVSLGGTAVNTIVTGQAYNGDEDGVAPGYGVVDAELKIYWLSTSTGGL